MLVHPVSSPPAVDGTAVAALAALLTVSTFSSGFLGVRMHDAHREALAGQRELDDKIGHVAHTDEPFPAENVEAQYAAIKAALADQIVAPVFLFLGVLTIGGIALAIAAGDNAGLRWFDGRSPGAFYGLMALGLGLLAVALLTGADYALLRRRLKRSLRDSIVGRLIEAERLSANALRIKRRLRDQDAERVGWNFGRMMAASQEKEAVERLDELNRVGSQDRDADWRARCDRLKRLRNERRRARKRHARRERSARRAVDKARATISKADRETSAARGLLIALSGRRGMHEWGYFVGVRAMVPLIEAYSPDLGWHLRGRPDIEEIHQKLVFATERDSTEARWWAARALVEEGLGKGDGAGEALVAYIRCTATSLEEQGELAEDSPLRVPPIRDRRAFLFPVEPDTYIKAYRILVGQSGIATPDADYALIMGFTCVRLNITDPLRNQASCAAATELTQLVRSAVDAHVNSRGELGWCSAESLAQGCRKQLLVIASQTTDGRHELDELDRIDEEVIRPLRDDFYARYARYAPTQAPG